jgi:hypothetical protein
VSVSSPSGLAAEALSMPGINDASAKHLQTEARDGHWADHVHRRDATLPTLKNVFNLKFRSKKAVLLFDSFAP